MDALSLSFSRSSLSCACEFTHIVFWLALVEHVDVRATSPKENQNYAMNSANSNRVTDRCLD